MPVIASLLRGINVGPASLIGMPALAAVHSALGLTEVRTLLRSGNVIFRSTRTDRAWLVRSLGDAIEKRFGIRPDVLLRSPEELRAAIAANPFPGEARTDPSHLLVMFLASPPSPASVRALAHHGRGPERVKASGQELYLYYPAGIGRSKLTNAFIEKALEVRGTARNWNTVNKLLQCAAPASTLTGAG